MVDAGRSPFHGTGDKVSGRNERWQRIYNEVEPIAFARARCIVPDLKTARQVAHDFATDLAEKWSKDPDGSGLPENIPAYVRRAMANFIEDTRRARLARQRRERQFDADLGAIERSWMDPESRLYLTDLELVIVVALEALPPARRECFLRVCVDRASHKVVAEERGISKWTLHRNIAEARAVLRPVVLKHQAEEDR